MEGSLTKESEGHSNTKSAGFASPAASEYLTELLVFFYFKEFPTFYETNAFVCFHVFFYILLFYCECAVNISPIDVTFRCGTSVKGLVS